MRQRFSIDQRVDLWAAAQPLCIFWGLLRGERAILAASWLRAPKNEGPRALHEAGTRVQHQYHAAGSGDCGLVLMTLTIHPNCEHPKANPDPKAL